MKQKKAEELKTVRPMQGKRIELLCRSFRDEWNDEERLQQARDLETFDGPQVAKDYFRDKKMRKLTCSICGCTFWDRTGRNPDPVIPDDEEAVCCAYCDETFVLPARSGINPGTFRYFA